MEALARIMEKVKLNNQLNSSSTVRCTECNDTGWLITEHGTYRKCNCVEIDYLKKLWENSGIKSDQQGLKLNDYKPYDELTTKARENAIDYIKNFDAIEGRESWFGLFGQPGSGKTHIVVSIGCNLINRKPSPVPVVYMPYLESTRELKANVKDDIYYNKLINRYMRSKVLIIDDLFKDKVKNGKLTSELNEADMKHIYPVLNYRYLNNLKTLISTECTPNMLLDLDEALAGRILESCVNHMTIFDDNKYNYRLRKFMK